MNRIKECNGRIGTAVIGCLNTAVDDAHKDNTHCPYGLSCYECNSGVWNGHACVEECSNNRCFNTPPANSKEVDKYCDRGKCYECKSGYQFKKGNCVLPPCPTFTPDISEGYLGCISTTPAHSVRDYNYGCRGSRGCYKCKPNYKTDIGGGGPECVPV